MTGILCRCRPAVEQSWFVAAVEGVVVAVGQPADRTYAVRRHRKTPFAKHQRVMDGEMVIHTTYDTSRPVHSGHITARQRQQTAQTRRRSGEPTRLPMDRDPALPRILARTPDRGSPDTTAASWCPRRNQRRGVTAGTTPSRETCRARVTHRLRPVAGGSTPPRSDSADPDPDRYQPPAPTRSGVGVEHRSPHRDRANSGYGLVRTRRRRGT